MLYPPCRQEIPTIDAGWEKVGKAWDSVVAAKKVCDTACKLFDTFDPRDPELPELGSSVQEQLRSFSMTITEQHAQAQKIMEAHHTHILEMVRCFVELRVAELSQCLVPNWVATADACDSQACESFFQNPKHHQIPDKIKACINAASLVSVHLQACPNMTYWKEKLLDASNEGNQYVVVVSVVNILHRKAPALAPVH